MVISALTISFPASLRGEAGELEARAQAMPVALGAEPPVPRLPASQRGARGGAGRGAGVRQSWGAQSWGAAPKAVHPVSREHLWTCSGYECPHRSWPWRRTAGAGQSRLPFLRSPRLCNWSPQFSLSETSGNEFFQSQWVLLNWCSLGRTNLWTAKKCISAPVFGVP